jgi:uncharacterized membrane protein YdbT with pleckstrin-like domain
MSEGKRDETGDLILYESNPSMWRQAPFTFLFFLALIPFFGLGILLLAIWWVQTLATELTLTENVITLRLGIFSKRLNQIRLGDVREISIDQTWFQRIMNSGRIEISSAATSDEADIAVTGMPDPERVRLIINKHRRASDE